MTTSPVSDTDRSPVSRSAPKPSSWGRLLYAQESGLVLVILLLGTILALATPSTQLRQRISLPPNATLESSAGVISVKIPGEGGGSLEHARYVEAEGYSINGLALIQTRTVNTFLSRQNLVGVAKDASFIAVMAVGITGVIILGGIDLSVGSIYALAGVLGAMALRSVERGHVESGDVTPALVAIPLGLLVPCAVGALCGLLNGLGTVLLNVHPFIITLGGMAVYRGVSLVLTDGQSIGEQPDALGSGFYKAQLFGVNPVPMIVMIVVGLIGVFFLARTVPGRQSYAVGGNETAAKYAGVAVGRIKIMWYVICGLLAGLAASMMLGYYGSASADSGSGYELKVIASAVVGGASLAGGRGSALGAVLGAIVIQLIDNGIILLNLSQYTNIVIGLAIVIAVVVDQAKARWAKG
jgi:ribose/xylose/arabinose/galactoside ABC-type transport system permease subunit